MSKIAPTTNDFPGNLLEALDEARARLDEVQEGLLESVATTELDSRLQAGIFSGSRDGIFILEQPDGKILRANEAAAALTGYPMEKLATMTIAALHEEAKRKEALKVFEEVGKTGWITSRRLDILRADGTVVPVSISAHVLAEKDAGYVVAFLRDVSERVASEKKLRELNEELEQRVARRTDEIHKSKLELEEAVLQAQLLEREARQANEAKSRFFAAMTHELRTPLNAVIGMSELLLDMELGREQQETADIIASSARGLLGVINDILDFSKIEAGKLELDETVFSLSELASGVTDTFTLQARQKGVALDLELGSDLPEYAIGDPVRLRQVLINLVGNALKFTDEGRVKVRVLTEDAHSGGRTIRFTVTDSGIGIPKDRQSELFVPFSQIGQEDGANRGGSGLGLSISRQIVERMNGMMGLKSKPGKGSTFWFTVRMADPSEAQLEEARRRVADEDLDTVGAEKDLKVLLVEDNPINLRVALGMFEKLGVEAEAAADGDEAVAMLTAERYDLVFMDIVIPGISGLEVTRRVRNEEAGELNVKTPIIAMTAHATRQDRQLCLDAGMDDYLAKPVSTEKIRQAMIRALDPDQAEPSAHEDPEIEQIVSDLDGQAKDRLGQTDAFLEASPKRLKVMIGALYNCDFGFARQECKELAEGAGALNTEGLAAMISDLERAISRRNQERALSLAKELQEILSGSPAGT